MSQENVEIVRSAYEDGWFDKDPERLLEHADEDVEYANPPEAIEPGTRRGKTEIRRAFANLQQGFEESRHEVRQLYGVGDPVVVADVTYIALSQGSAVELVQREAHTWTFRDGKIVRFEWGRDLQAALEAAGMSE
jgi:ketosteroid isomerase-like protein